MAFHYSPKIVTDGLMLYVDASNSKSFSTAENKLLYSSEIGVQPGVIYIYGGVVTTLSAATAPDGTLTATLIDQTGVTNNYIYTQTGILATGTTYTYSIYVKQGTNPTYATTIDEHNFGSQRYQLVYTFATNVVTATVSTGGKDGYVINSGAIDVGNGWHRLFMTFHTSTTGVDGFVDMMSRFCGGGTVYVWGRQLEKKDSLTNYTPTSASTIEASTTWTDLSRSSKNGTLTNGPTFSSISGNSIYFDGVNNEVDFSVTPGALGMTGGNFSVEVMINASDVFPISGSGGLVSAAGSNTLGGAYEMLIRSNNLIVDFYGESQAILINANTWYNIIHTYNYTTKYSNVYKNAILAATSTRTVGLTGVTGNLAVGIYPYGGGYFSGRTGFVKVYNKELSPAEVTQNFNATKGRFGL